MNQKELYALGIDIGSTTVKIAILDENNEVVFSDYERHFANIQETLSDLLGSNRCIYCSPGLCTSDRRCYRTRRRRCQDYLL